MSSGSLDSQNVEIHTNVMYNCWQPVIQKTVPKLMRHKVIESMVAQVAGTIAKNKELFCKIQAADFWVSAIE